MSDTITAADRAAAEEIHDHLMQFNDELRCKIEAVENIIARHYATRNAASDKMAEALTRMISATERYLQEQIPGDAQLYDPEYVSPLAQARSALSAYEAAK